MGGKSKSQPAPPAPMMPPQQDNSAEIMNMMAGMMGMMSSMPQPPSAIPAPEIEREPVINWQERQEQLLAKTKADYSVDQASKKGRTDTILTSPLLDEEDATTTSSLLTSKK